MILKPRSIAAAVGAAILAGGLVIPAVSARPKGPDAKERREERREDRQERREERREDRQERREDRREDRQERREDRQEDRKERREEWRKTYQEKKAHFDELKKKEADGSLSDDEKSEMDRMKKRHTALEKARDAWQDRHKKRVERRREARRDILKKWGPIYKRPKVRIELTKHATRMAHLNRMRYLADQQDNEDALKRIDKLIQTENARHERRMGVLKGEKE